MTTSKAGITTGTDLNVATYSFSEDAVTKHLQRFTLSDSSGAEVTSWAVTGTFFQATQPVSGTFWQATQPVSGTFWQATQPVSIAALPALAAGGNVIGAVTQSGTWNVGTVTTVTTVAAVTAITNALPAGSNAIGKLAANSGVTIGAVEIATSQTVGLVAGSAVIGQVFGATATITTGVTRPNDTTTYAANENWSDSASAPTAGGFTLTGAGRISGGGGIITDMEVISTNDPALLLQGEIWIYDSAVATVDNDNSAFTSSDADTLLKVTTIPFVMQSTQGGTGSTSFADVQGLSVGFNCVGSANLRFKIKVKNAYIPAAQEVLTVRLKVQQTN